LDSPKEKNNKKKTPGSLACGFTCAAWDKNRSRTTTKKSRVLSIDKYALKICSKIKMAQFSRPENGSVLNDR